MCCKRRVAGMLPGRRPSSRGGRDSSCDSALRLTSRFSLLRNWLLLDGTFRRVISSETYLRPPPPPPQPPPPALQDRDCQPPPPPPENPLNAVDPLPAPLAASLW